MEKHSRLQFFPVSFFAIIMGLTGLAIADQRAEKILGLPAGTAQVLAWLSAGMFILLASLYASKLVRFRMVGVFFPPRRHQYSFRADVQ